jgi:hypothetical protein
MARRLRPHDRRFLRPEPGELGRYAKGARPVAGTHRPFALGKVLFATRPPQEAGSIRSAREHRGGARHWRAEPAWGGSASCLFFARVFAQARPRARLRAGGRGNWPPLDRDYILSILCWPPRAKTAIILSYCICWAIWRALGDSNPCYRRERAVS